MKKIYLIKKKKKKKDLLNNIQNSQENTCARVSYLYFSAFRLNTERYGVSLCIFSLNAGKYKKETLAQVLSCEFYEIFKNIFFRRLLLFFDLSKRFDLILIIRTHLKNKSSQSNPLLSFSLGKVYLVSGKFIRKINIFYPVIRTPCASQRV